MSAGSYRDSHIGKGNDYQNAFAERPNLAMAWQVERSVLDQIGERRFAGRPFRYLDFACGTGRILAHVSRRAAEAVGVDISPTMLEVARRRVPHATIIQGDLTRESLLADARFDLITAFRFFPNAEPALREQVIAALVDHLAPGGVIVFNNHQNALGIHRRLVRLVRHDPGHEMTAAEVQALVAGAGLRVVRRHGVGLLPLPLQRIPAPVPLVARIELRLSSTTLSKRWAGSVIHECEVA